MSKEKSLVLFDGICNLCSTAVIFILKRDCKDRFRFASLQSESAGIILNKYNFFGNFPDTIVLIEKGKVYLKSTAVLRIVRHLRGAWPLFYGFIIFPVFIRDRIYDWVARNRFHWFGRKSQCYIPDEKWKDRFIG
jgi:predicted DCC family thiol-disulfide oxidoreductase YuxK